MGFRLELRVQGSGFWYLFSVLRSRFDDPGFSFESLKDGVQENNCPTPAEGRV